MTTERTRRLAQQVRWQRRMREMSTQEVADRTRLNEDEITVTRSVIANIENGRRSYITMDEVFALAAAFGIHPSVLLNDELNRTKIDLTSATVVGRSFRP